jgi:hypothetical protein
VPPAKLSQARSRAKCKKWYHNTERLSWRPDHPVWTLSRLSQQSSLCMTGRFPPIPSGFGAFDPGSPIQPIYAAKQALWPVFDGPNSAAKDTKPKGFSP